MAFISDERRWAFVHVPKNGGNAVFAYLNGFALKEDIRVMDHLQHGLPLHQHSTATEIARWMSDTGRHWSSYRSFAVVRDPFTRPQSVFTELHRNWTWAKRVGGDEWWERFIALSGPSEFVTSGMFDPDGPNYITHPQVEFIEDVEYVFTLRDMRHKIPALLGLPGTIPLVHKGQYSPDPLSPDARRYVERHFAEDIKVFRYLEGHA